MKPTDEEIKPIQKEAKKPVKRSFDVRVEFLIPATITYRVQAFDEKEALKEAEKPSARVSHKREQMNRRIKLKATVLLPSSSTVKLQKTYRSL